MPAVERTKYKEEPKKEWENKEQLAVPEWHLPFINNQLLQLRAQGKQVDEDLMKRFYHLPHSVADEVQDTKRLDTEASNKEATVNQKPVTSNKVPVEQKKNSNYKSAPVHKHNASLGTKTSKNQLRLPKVDIAVSSVPDSVVKSLKSLVDGYLVGLYLWFLEWK